MASLKKKRSVKRYLIQLIVSLLLSESPIQPFGGGVKQLSRQFVQSSSKKQLCWGTFSVFLKLKGCDFIIKGVRRRCCPMTFAKFFRMFTQNMSGCFWSLCYTGHISRNFEKRFFVCLLYWYNYWTKIRKSRN